MKPQKTLKTKQKWPSFKQWRQVFKVLNKKEKKIFFIFLILALVSGIYLIALFYSKNTQLVAGSGGSFAEGMVGQPRLINPIYASVSDVDRDLVEILFAGLLKYNGAGEVIPDLAKDIQIQQEGLIYELTLRENILWHDKTPITADDVIFTIKTIQNPEYKSPLRAAWLGVRVTKTGTNKIRFELDRPYLPFLETLTLKILPKHLWENIPAASFPLAILNLEPIGSGPYQLKRISQDKLGKVKSLEVVRFKNYWEKSPFISKITFYFFETEDDLIKSAKSGNIQGLSLASTTNYEPLIKKDFLKYSPALPRYFAVFFNLQKSTVLKEKNVRTALSLAINKQEIINEILNSEAKIINSPLLPDIYGIPEPEPPYQYIDGGGLENAKEILDKEGFKETEGGKRVKYIKKTEATVFKSDLKVGSQGAEVTELQTCLAKAPQIYPEGKITGYFGDQTKAAVIRFQEKYSKDILEPWGFKAGTGLVGKTTREKLNEVCGKISEEILPLKFSLVTIDQTQMVEVANLLKAQWQAVGAEIDIIVAKSFELEQDFIKPRNYDALLFGEVLGTIPDPFPFWHSTQKKDPGLNLCQYENKEADKLLEQARQSLDSEIRKEKLSKFQDILLEDVPAIFLYNPNYLYLVSDKIKGIELKIIPDPSKRFAEIEKWYTETKRTWK